LPPIGHFYLLIFAVLFWAVVLVAAVWLVMWAIRVAPRRVRPDSALHILDERFARGEIDQQEYQARKAELTKR
jgi:putative membrane protein